MFAKLPSPSCPPLAVPGCAAQAQARAGLRGFRPDPAVTSVTVSVGDLNLDDRAGAKTALQRIHAAAKTVCGEEPGHRRDRAHGSSTAPCIRTSTDRAVASLDSPIATAMNGGRPDTAMMVANGR